MKWTRHILHITFPCKVCQSLNEEDIPARHPSAKVKKTIKITSFQLCCFTSFRNLYNEMMTVEDGSQMFSGVVVSPETPRMN